MFNQPPTAPAWIAPFCHALADALEDEQLSEDTRNRLTELVNDIDQQHTADYPTIARRMLPVAFHRARSGADAETPPPSVQTPALPTTQEPPAAPSFAGVCAALAEPLRAFLNHPDTDKGIASEIAEQFRQAFDDYTPQIRPGDYVAQMLTGFAAAKQQGVAAASEIDDACEALARLLEDEAFPVAAHNELTDCLTDATDIERGSPADDARRLLPAALRRFQSLTAGKLKSADRRTRLSFASLCKLAERARQFADDPKTPERFVEPLRKIAARLSEEVVSLTTEVQSK